MSDFHVFAIHGNGHSSEYLPGQLVMNGSGMVCMLPYSRFFPPFRLAVRDVFPVRMFLRPCKNRPFVAGTGGFGKWRYPMGFRLWSGQVIDAGVPVACVPVGEVFFRFFGFFPDGCRFRLMVGRLGWAVSAAVCLRQ